MPSVPSESSPEKLSSFSSSSFSSPTTIYSLCPDYQTTNSLDTLRETEYAYLDNQDHVYLDYTGAGLPATSQHVAHHARMSSSVFGNPHSANPTSEASTRLINSVRARVLQHLNANEKEYVVIFTANASAAARLVGESYPFSKGGSYVLTADNHNSVNGIREIAKRKGAGVEYVPLRAPELRVATEDVHGALKGRERGRGRLLKKMLCGMSRQPESKKSGLFAFPAQSNFSGVKHPLEWVGQAQERGYDVLLDAAAFLPTSMLDLSTVKPEFVIASWYKVFGYPTGVGCLIARKDALARLNRPWFAGGTVTAVAVKAPWHLMENDEAAWEDGTANFLSIPDVQFGLDWIAAIGMSTIQTRVQCLTAYCLHRMRTITHSSNQPLFEIYGPLDTLRRGGTIPFNVLDAEGKWVDERLVDQEAGVFNISLRTGCFCNPGAAEEAFGLDDAIMKSLLASTKGQMESSVPPTKDDILRMVGMTTAGAIRISFGLVSNVKDVDRFIGWAEKTYKDRITGTEGLAPR